MAENDYSWDNYSELNSSLLTADVLPRRFALTAPQVVRRTAGEILLVDPHTSGSWETWMFPYASLVMTAEEIIRKCAERNLVKPAVLQLDARSSFEDLSTALHSLRQTFQQDYSDAIESGVNNLLPQLQDGWNGRPFYENFSLKFSKTSNSYTAYDFEYYLNIVKDMDLDVPHLWIDASSLRNRLVDAQDLDGRPVSSNVIEAVPALLRL